jgi:endonuclease YncB( thermonuclease family)
MRLGRVASQWIVVLILLLVLAVINHYRPDLTGFEVDPSTKNQREASGGTYQAIDGDSFKAGQIEVRLHGIDAPEYRQSCKDASGQSFNCGKSARDVLSKLLRGRSVSCRIIDKDRYGRQVSVCRDGETDINREMVRLGWAVAYRKHSGAYVSAESEARKAKRGIWQGTFEAPDKYRDRQRAVEGSLAGDD